MSRAWVRATALVLGLVAFAGDTAVAIEDSKLFTANAKYLRRFMSFEFGAGGTADVVVDWNANVVLPLRIYVCDTAQMSTLLERYNSIEEICVDYNSTGGCEAVINVNDGLGSAYGGGSSDVDTSSGSGTSSGLIIPGRGQRWAANIDRHVILNFHYLNCNSVTTKFRMTYSLLNQGDEQLGLGQIPLKVLYESLFVIWICLIVLIFVDILHAITCKGLRVLFTQLHTFILITATLTTVSVGVEQRFWLTLSRTGKMDDGLRQLGDLIVGLRSES